jgi:signal transduction histidine kinase
MQVSHEGFSWPEATADSARERPSSTDLAHTAEELSEQVAELRAAIKARDAFILMATHELRGPIAPLYGQLELLQMIARRQRLSRQIVAGMDRLRLAMDGFMHRANTLLDTARIASGKRKFHYEETDLSELVQYIVENYQVIARQANCELVVTIEGGLVSWWDRLAIEEIVENLLSNAFRHGTGKPVHVTLASDTDGVRLAVRDEGAGISEADQRRIFAPFEQIAIGTERRGGFGVGLWVVRQLVDAMKGKLEVNSGDGAGAEFMVWLPYLDSAPRNG